MAVCKLGVWDDSIPGIVFDDQGISNYAKLQLNMMRLYPRGEKGLNDWGQIVKTAKRIGRKSKYDCIVGVSGGVDSTYLLYLAKEIYGLRPLAVNLDNGWNSDIAVKNIKKITNALNVDLETYVIDYEEIKDFLRSYMRAGLPWIDTPTDTAIKSVMYKIALETGVKHIFRGNDFRSEGKQPLEWTYSDSRQMNFVYKKYGHFNQLNTYPSLPFYKIIYAGFLKGIKDIRPYYYLDYKKQEARAFLEKQFGWEYYGGHHHENLFTKFVMSYWLPAKFNIDKRKITLSAQILSGAISRDEALEILNNPPYEQEYIQRELNFILKKLDFTKEEFDTIWSSQNKNIYDYPSNLQRVRWLFKFFNPLIKLVYPQKPMTFLLLENEQK